MTLYLPILDRLPPHSRDLTGNIATEADRLGVSVYLVGGPIRDLILEQPSTDLDFTVEGDAASLVKALVTRFGGHTDFKATNFFGTAKWYPNDGVVVDFARTRREHYAHPGALPTVDPHPVLIEEDLYRRDFTINALAINILTGDLIDPYGGVADLRNGLIRVLHDQSFIDDPTRLFRAVRFDSRLAFQIEANTARLIPDALPIIDRLSGERITNEIEKIFGEFEPDKALVMLDTLNILKRVHPDLRADDWLVAACRALRWCFDSTTPNALTINYWSILACRIENTKRFALPKAVTDAISHLRQLYLGFDRLVGDELPSVYVPIFENCPEFAAWAIAPLAAHRAQLESFQNHWKYVYPTLTGNDLKALGLRPGPVFRTILDRLRGALLDGQISTLTEELALVQGWIDQQLYS